MKKTDRRIAKTKIALHEGLMALMLAKNWDDINVQMICDHADIARSTFYTHFDNKNDLLDFGFDRLIEHLGLVESSGEQKNGYTLSFLPALIEHIYDHGKLFERLSSNANGIVIMNKFKSIIRQGTEAEIKALKPDISDLQISFIAGGIFGILEGWHAEHFKAPQALILVEIDKLVTYLAK